MLVKLPNGVFVKPESVMSVVAGPDTVSVMLSLWNHMGNFFEVISPSDGQTVEQLRDEIVGMVNKSC